MSLDLEIGVGNELALYSVFLKTDHSYNASWTSITIASKRYCWSHKLFCFLESHVRAIICVKITPNKSWAWTWQCPITLFPKSSLIYWVNLIAFIGIPPWANHTRRKWTCIVINDLSHNLSCRFHWRKSIQFLCLSIDVVSNHFSNHTCVWRCTWSLTIYSVMDWF